MEKLSRAERRNRGRLIIAMGVLAMIVLGAWTVILRRAPIEDDLTGRAAAALETAGIDATGLRFDGRDGSLTVQEPLAGTARAVVEGLEGVRTVAVATVPPPTTTTTTVPTTTTTTPAPTTTTTVPPPPEASLTLTADAGIVTLSGTLHPTDADAVAAAARGVFGSEGVEDALTRDAAALRPPWAAALPDALAALAYVEDPGLAIAGDTATVAGGIASEDRRAQVLAAFEPLGLALADGLSIAAPPDPDDAAALEAALNASLEDASILFETGSAEIADAGSAQLTAIADLLIAVPGARVEVGGHTDSVGPADGNLLLSLARAEAVVAYLVDLGVDPVQLTAAGYGEQFPIADNGTPEGRAANRRIEFTVEGSA